MRLEHQELNQQKHDGTKGFPAHATITRLPDNTLQEITYNSHLTQDRYKTG